jgi:2'-5' RNA ligase
MIRTFIAVETSEAVRRRAVELIRALDVAGADVKWVEPQNMHLTLKFLGDVAEADVPGVCQAVQEAVAGVQPFDMAVRGAGAFPSAGRPRTLWLGAAAGAEAMIALQAAVEKPLRALGFPKEHRRFEPHLTIGRVRGGGPTVAELGRLVRQFSDFDAGPFRVVETVVFASHLSPKGATYEALGRAPLGG